MDNKSVYSTKAEYYARYRWDYAPQALDFTFQRAQLDKHSVVADLGAGTGILTRHFVGKVGQVYAVEPNPEMRRILERDLGGHASLQVLGSCAEATGLPNQCADLISVAQAIHWFEPAPTRAEMRRVLKPGGWLAILRNYSFAEEWSEALGHLMSPAYGANFTASGAGPRVEPPRYYYQHGRFEPLTFQFAFQQTWEQFFGALLSASYMPDEDHPLFASLEQEAHRIFNQYSREGVLPVRGETELVIGQME